jgi:hypothetical protein
MTARDPGPRAAGELRLADRFPGSLRAGNMPAALIQPTALHDLRELAAGGELRTTFAGPEPEARS